ncbi:MAG TPA: nitroreductase family protein [Chloroflexota bacterium]|nr:nitroreductase family protein [Chloroflexota bacterium]
MSADPTELLEFLRRLRQVREYTSEAVSEDVINGILEVGRWSGSGSNKQPTELIVIRDPGTKRQIGDWGAKPVATCAVAFLIVSKNESPGVDEGRLGERLMLAAAAHGLGAGIATLKEQGPEAVKLLLGIPSELHAQVVVSVGHIDREARRALAKRPGAPRKPMDEFAHWERYDLR